MTPTFKRRSMNPIGVAALQEQLQWMGLDCYGEVVGLGGKAYRAVIEAAFEGTPVSLAFPLPACRSAKR